ncbi:biosynthetic arginine decarboxylase [Pseudenhygromyxa sp. WMMC2535]|uniref:biosynthetic arginine decarboxylase n=1 Tax=Pseudenhygromyxa sp. WMMC2535 TaxID=2712867 RepID=UPI0015547878|nr:biosynthetic arginine decarboxylase [Pseudenhygromyxa sp. WMMC2535]NVB36995.1 biosynthetic arginine decarboxylase [Pseudenhygromyxa sp. WMMC2535]
MASSEPKTAANTAPAAGTARAKKSWALENSLKRYGVDKWGEGFLGVNAEGRLTFRASGLPEVDLQKIALVLRERGIHSPFIVRFPSMIVASMKRLHDAFVAATQEYDFEGGHVGMFPLKVNQRRSVVETVVSARESCGYGLEAGSKPELLLAMAQPVSPAPLICNGYKDREFIRLGFHAAELGHEVVLVLESMREVRRYLDILDEQEWSSVPHVGMRAKLYSRGSGRWQSSGGERAKFGLTTAEMLSVVRSLEAAGQVDKLALLHFHIGSQITQIKRIKTAVREGIRLWCSLRARCPGLRYIDLGGGVGVDYDGSRTSYPSSANYTIEEYASQVVFEINEVVSELELPAPTIVTESGRVLVAKHAVTIADLREVQGELLPVPTPSEREDRLISELRDTLEHITTKNIEEYFHDAVDYRDEALQLFSRGYLSLEDRASAEGLFQRIRLECARLISQMSHPPEEIVTYLGRAQVKYLANFSIFQSLPDNWAIDHVFPAAPLSGHGSVPTINAEIVDITCDSDGCVTTFAHPEDNLKALPLHEPPARSGEPYYLGFFMTGAYQDSLGNAHNLFGRCHEVIVRGTDEEGVILGSQCVDYDDEVWLEVKSGYSVQDMLAEMDYDVESITQMIRDRHLNVSTTLGQPWAMGLLQEYPYLIRT